MDILKKTLKSVRLITGSPGDYLTRLAQSAEDVRAAQKLRFEVFNLEMHEGLEQSYATGLDAEPLDVACDHLLVEHKPTGQIVGTYRLQTGANAAAKLGYYCEQEFEFQVFEPLRAQMVELGRACVEKQHRNLVVLGLLWKGIVGYASQRGGRYLCGCSSITSQDAAVGAAAYIEMSRKYLVEPQWRTRPQPSFHCPLEPVATDAPKIPKLLRAYLSIGAKICGPPALDRQFKTIDFLTLVDLESLSPVMRARLFD